MDDTVIADNVCVQDALLTGGQMEVHQEGGGLSVRALTDVQITGAELRDNVAVGVAFAGALVGVGNVLRVGLSGDFESWSANLTDFAYWTVAALVLLPVMRFLSDKLLAPGVSLTAELVQAEKPNVGAGFIEAFSYVAASMLIGWAI